MHPKKHNFVASRIVLTAPAGCSGGSSGTRTQNRPVMIRMHSPLCEGPVKWTPPEKTPRRSPKTYASITWCRNSLSGRRSQTNQFDWTDPLFCLLGYDQNQRRLCGVQIHICATFKAGFYLSIAVPVESYNRGQRINGDGAGGRTRTGDTAPGLQHSTN